MLPYCSCCWLAPPFPVRDPNRIDPLSSVQTLQTPLLCPQPCPSTSYLLQARGSGLPLCLLSVPAWFAQEGHSPCQRYMHTAQLIMFHLLLNAFTFAFSTMTSIIPPKSMTAFDQAASFLRAEQCKWRFPQVHSNTCSPEVRPCPCSGEDAAPLHRQCAPASTSTE